MTRAWLEIDRVSDVTSVPGVWERLPLDPTQHTFLMRSPRHVTLTTDTGPASANAAATPIFDVAFARDRWMLQPRMHDIYRNGVQLLLGERYPLDNGDRIEAMRGTWLRFLDDTVPLPLPRLRQIGRAFLFAPTPADGADRWHLMLRGRDEVFAAELVASALHEDGEEMLLAAFPFVVDAVHTPRGVYALTRGAAGVSLAALLARTREQDASLDDAVVDEIRVRCADALEIARVARWPQRDVFAETVTVTWEGNVVWLGFTQPRREEEMIRFAVPSTSTATTATPADEEVKRTLAGVVAQLFPDEHATEMALREEVALWTRDGLAELERVTRGRPSP